MRLLLLSSEFPPGPGGIGTHAYQLAKSLTAKGWDVEVVTPQDYAGEQEVEAFNAAQSFEIQRLHPVPGPPLEAVWRGFCTARRISRERPDVLLASGKRAVWLAACVAGLYRLPWLAVGHGTEFGSTVAWDRTLTRWAFESAAAVVCVSQYTYGKMCAMGVHPRGSRVIPNGADASQFRLLPPAEAVLPRKQLGLEQVPLLLTVGRVSERKGQDVVIRALPYILEKIPDVHYLAAGLPEQGAPFQALAEALGVGAHVHFLGRVDPEVVVRLQNCCDVFVMTSKHTAEGAFEGYGIAAVEAALCGKPAVVSANSGLSEAVVEGETGWVVPENDERATAAAVLALLTDEALRRRMGAAARARALKLQTWDHRAGQYDVLLRSLVDGDSRTADVHEQPQDG